MGTKRFSASSAARLMACPASGNLDVAIPGWVEPAPNPAKFVAKGKGTNIHKVFEEAWELGVTDLEHVVSCMDYVAKLKRTRRFKVMSEVTMKATWLQTEPDTTADLVLYTQDELHIIDTKTGKIPVEVHNNEQLLFGAVTYGHLAPKAKGVTLHILQPWAGIMDSQYVSTLELMDFKQRALDAEAKLLAKDTTFGPSDHCTFCPANPHSRGEKGSPLCPSMMQLLYPGNYNEEDILNL